jgi:predicted Zn-dependent protease
MKLEMKSQILTPKEDKALSELDRVLDQMTKTPLGRRHFLAAVPFLISACASGGGSRYREGDNAGQETEITVDDERRMTREALQEMKKDYPALKDADMQNYISAMGNRIAAANGLQGNPYDYSFTVVDVPYVNAFALPAGTIYITTPLIAMADSEAELAGVVGHEIGHVTARHTAERMDQQKKGTSSWVYALGGGLLGGAAGFGIGKLICPPSDNDCLQKAATLGAAAGGAGGLLVQKYKFMANSREDEMEADRIGFKTSVKAGYSPKNVGDFYAKLQKMEDERSRGGQPLLASLADAMSTHPPSRERVNQMNELAAATPGSAKAIVSSSAFDRIRKRANQLKKPTT